MPMHTALRVFDDHWKKESDRLEAIKRADDAATKIQAAYLTAKELRWHAYRVETAKYVAAIASGEKPLPETVEEVMEHVPMPPRFVHGNCAMILFRAVHDYFGGGQH